MVIKINYTSSDIYVSTNVSPVYVVVNYSGTSDTNAVWGQITGTLSNQTDLQNALNAKFDDPTGTTSQYLRGDGSLATFPTIPSGTVTSVGLTMPSAFAVANSPVTSSGTLAVTGAGTADQYVRGDGQLANFPTNGGGGSSVNYYLNGSVSQGTFGGDTYYEMSKTPIIGAGTNFTRTNAQGNGYIASFITDAGDPALLNIPGGNWNVEFYFQASSNGSNPSFYAELYKVSSSNVFTLIGSGSTNPEGITNGTAVDQYYTSIPVPQTALLATDRLAVRIFVTPSGRTITLHTENGNLCEVLTTFSTGLNALNGLTAQVQYFATGTSGTDFAISSATDTHTFNLPIASGTNTGKLSNSDWTTFNNKVSGSGATGQVAYWNGTNSQTGSNNLFWDAANARLGIGTATPSGRVHIVSTTVNDALLVITPNNNSSQYPFFLGGATLTSDNYLRANNSNIEFFRNGVAATIRTVGSSNNLVLQSSTDLLLNTNGANERVRIFTSTGNVGINTGSTDGGQRLQVYGDAFIKGSGATSATNALLVQNSAGTQLLKIQNDGTGNIPYIFYVGHNSTNPFLFSFDGNSSSSANASGRNLAYYNTNTTQTGDQSHFALVGNALTPTSGDTRLLLIERSFAPTSGTAIFTAQRIISTINQTGGANGITRGIHIQPTLTAAADWRSIEWSNNSGWGLYGAGTANNYLAGSLGIGTTSPQSLLQVGSYTGTGAYTYGTTATFANSWNASRPTIVLISNTNTLTQNKGGGIGFAGGTEAAASPYMFAQIKGLKQSSGADYSGYLAFYTTGSDSNFESEKMRLTSGGNLLVGTTTDSGYRVQITGSGDNMLNVWGATAPSIRLDNAASAATQKFVIGLATATNNFIQGATAGEFCISAQSTGNMLFGMWGTTNASEVMRITTANNLIIGSTTDAGYRLDVNGTGRFSGNVTVNNTITATQLTAATAAISATSFWSGTVNNPIIIFGRFGLAVAGAIGYDETNTGLYIGTTTNHRFAIRTNNSDRLTIASTGDATFSSSVQAGGGTTNASAILQADSTTKGFLPPRMTTTEKNAITSPAAGLIVYDTTLNKLCVRTAAAWETITSL